MVIFSILSRTSERQPANVSFNLLEVDFVLFSSLSPCFALSHSLCLDVTYELILILVITNFITSLCVRG